MAYSYEYPRPALTVDCTVFRPNGRRLEILLVERDESPFEGHWATPGGFVEIEERVETAAYRELQEETGLEPDRLHQFGVFSEPDRDPRGRVISNGYWGLIPDGDHAEAATDAREVAWHDIEDLPALAFDHAQIVSDGLVCLRRRARTGPIGLEVLQSLEPFDWQTVVELYETVLGIAVDGDALTEAWLRSDLIDESDEGLRCRPTAFEQTSALGISPWFDD